MRKAFTAIELMIVVAILMLLVGILVPVVAGMRERSKIKLAKSRVRAIALALDQFRLDKGQYPRGSTETDPTLIYASLADGFMEFKKDERRAEASSYVALDPWGNPWQYCELLSRFERRLDEAAYNGLVAELFAHNSSSFDLYSYGPNGTKDAWMHDLIDNDENGKIDETGEKSSRGATNDDAVADDIANW
jgi:type II secretion system protein G